MRTHELEIVTPDGDAVCAVNAAAQASEVVAHPVMAIPGHGSFAIYIVGGVQHGLWQK